MKDEEQKRIEIEYAKSRCLIKSIKEDEGLMQLFNLFPKLHVFITFILFIILNISLLLQITKKHSN